MCIEDDVHHLVQHSSTARTAISVSATWVQHLQDAVRLLDLLDVRRLARVPVRSCGTRAVSSRDSSPTERMMVPASVREGLPSSSTTFALERLAEGELDTSERDAVSRP
jgi:hypothetical protein